MEIIGLTNLEPLGSFVTTAWNWVAALSGFMAVGLGFILAKFFTFPVLAQLLNTMIKILVVCLLATILTGLVLYLSGNSLSIEALQSVIETGGPIDAG